VTLRAPGGTGRQSTHRWEGECVWGGGGGGVIKDRGVCFRAGARSVCVGFAGWGWQPEYTHVGVGVGVGVCLTLLFARPPPLFRL
jgi:hypothetical protein